MNLLTRRLEQFEQAFGEQQCWMIEALAAHMGYAVVSVRRFLKQIGYYRSYNDNGKWYTLHTIPRFDAYGIWLYEQIGFSREGSLTATILSLVRKSPLGLSAAELSAILHRRSHAVLTMMHKSGRIEQVKYGPEFRYLCADQTINARQRRALRPRLSESPAEPLSEEAAVFVLVAYIKDSALSFAELARQLRQEKQIRLSARTIADFFARQGIKKKR